MIFLRMVIPLYLFVRAWALGSSPRTCLSENSDQVPKNLLGHAFPDHALVGQEAFLVDARDRIAKHIVATRKTARRTSTVSKRAFSTVMDHRPGGSATKTSLGGAMHPLGVGRRRPSQNCGRGHHSYRRVFHGYSPSTRTTVSYPRDAWTKIEARPDSDNEHAC
jgi:hypothetical protein